MSLNPRKDRKFRSFRKKKPPEPEMPQRVVVIDPDGGPATEIVVAKNVADAERSIEAIKIQLGNERRPERRKQLTKALRIARVKVARFKQSMKKDEPASKDISHHQPTTQHQPVTHQGYTRPQQQEDDLESQPKHEKDENIAENQEKSLLTEES